MKIIIFASFFLLSYFLLSCDALLAVNNTTNNTNQDIKIPILQIVEHPALNATRQGITDELAKAHFLTDYESAQGNPALASQIAQKFVGNNPKVMVGIGTTATQSLIASNRQKKIPIIFSSVTDPIAAHIVSDQQHSNENITGVSNFIDPALQFTLFKKVLPNLTRLGIIYNPGEANSVSLVSSMDKSAPQFEINLIKAAANNSAEVTDATLSLIKKVDAIFINNDNTALSAFDAIIKIANQNNIPVFASDTELIEKGAILALGPDQYALGTQTGKMIIEIINGKPIKNIPVSFPEKTDLYLNLKAMKLLNISVPDAVLKEAKIVYQ